MTKTLTKKKISSFVEWLEKATQWLIYASVILVPLIFVPYLNTVFTSPKLYIFRIITLLIILIWGIKSLFKPKISIWWVSFFWFVLAYAAVSIINTVFTVNFWSSLFGTYGRFIGLITILNLLFWVFVIIAEMRSREKIIKLLWCSVITALIVAVYGIFQHFDLWVNVFSWSQDPTDRVFSTIGHSNHVAAYLGMNLMLLIGLIRTTEFGWRKVSLWAITIVLIWALILTASRGGVFAVLVALICWLVYGLRKKHFIKEIKKFSKLILFIITLLFLAGVVFRGPLSNLTIVQRTVGTVEFIKEGNVPDRVSWWISSIEMIKDKPIIGHGLSTYRDIYNKYRRTDYRVEDDAQDHITPQSAHMEYLNIWALQGTLGLFIYLVMIVSVFVYGYLFMIKAQDYKDRTLMYSLLTATIVYLVQVLVSFGVIVTLFMLYTFIGLIMAFIRIEKGGRSLTFKPHILLRIGFTVICLSVFVVGCWFSFANLAAEYNYKQAKNIASKKDFIMATNKYQKAIYWMPYVSEYYEDYADYLFETGIQMPDSSQETYLKDSLDIYDKALNLNSNLPYVHINKGLTASRLADLNKNDPEKAEVYKMMALDEHQTAVDLSSNNPVYPYKYGKQLLFFGFTEEAIEQFNKVLEIRDPYEDTHVLIEQNL